MPNDARRSGNPPRQALSAGHDIVRYRLVACDDPDVGDDQQVARHARSASHVGEREAALDPHTRPIAPQEWKEGQARYPEAEAIELHG